MIAISWYASQVVQQFYDPFNGGIRWATFQCKSCSAVPHCAAEDASWLWKWRMSTFHRYELGAGLFLGWGGSSLSILGGALLCCGCKRASTGKRGWVLATCHELVLLRACDVDLIVCFRPTSGYHANQPKVYKAQTYAKSEQESSRAYVWPYNRLRGRSQRNDDASTDFFHVFDCLLALFFYF